MQDRPTYDELLAFIEKFLDEEIVPNVPGARGFHARVAANALRIVQREMESREATLGAEWDGLDALLGAAERPRGSASLAEAIRVRNAELCDRIRSGNADSGGYGDRVFAHVMRTVADKLRVSDPALLERSGEAPAQG